MTSTSASNRNPVNVSDASLIPNGSEAAPYTQNHTDEESTLIQTRHQDMASISSSSHLVTDSATTPALHHPDSTTQEYPPSALTFFDATLKPVPHKSASPSAPLTITPTPPSPTLQRTAIREHPAFNPEELRQTFPTELPPRPPPKRNFFSRIFKHQPRQSEDIELSHTPIPESHRPRSCYKEMSFKDKVIVLGSCALVGIGLVAWFTLLLVHDIKALENNGHW